MTLDLQSYLLSSSPPDFEFPNTVFTKQRRSPRLEVTGIEFNNPADSKPSMVSSELWRLQEILIAEESLTPQEEFEGFGLTKCTNRSNDTDRIRTWQSSYKCNADQCSCAVKQRKKSRRKVTFADDAGLELSEYLSIPEASDEPPVLRFDLLSLVSRNQAVDSPAEKQAVSLAVNFTQPAADYLEFYNKVSMHNVSLENIIVRDNWQLVGTVKVKNIASHKHVYVRLTCDSWSNCHDVSAEFVDTGRSVPFGQFETFSFETTVTSTISPSLVDPVQFAVCFCADGHEYWDNNNGQNYKISIETKTLDALTSDSVDGLSSTFSRCASNQPTALRVNNGYHKPGIGSPFMSNCYLPEASHYPSYNSVDAKSPYW